MHSSIQLDPTALIRLRDGQRGTKEIVVLDPNSECSFVMELSADQLKQIAALATQ